jgi:ribosomal 50S subunit-associated protein YjgA (DUF615 family)
MTVQQIAEAIFEELFADIIYSAEDSKWKPQADMMNKLFRHQQVEKIKRVLEKSSETRSSAQAV